MTQLQPTKDILGRIIRVTANQKNRSYTIYVNGQKRLSTGRMSQQEFDECYHCTANDWADYLRHN